MLIQTKNKNDAIKAFINLWLKDPRWYCNNCGQNYGYQELPKPPFTCCKEPQVGRNIDHTKGVISQNKDIRESRKNDYGSDEGKNMRWGVSMPPMLLQDLEKYFKKHYEQKLFENREELHSFMKNFPQFSVCRKV